MKEVFAVDCHGEKFSLFSEDSSPVTPDVAMKFIDKVFDERREKEIEETKRRKDILDSYDKRSEYWSHSVTNALTRSVLNIVTTLNHSVESKSFESVLEDTDPMNQLDLSGEPEQHQ